MNDLGEKITDDEMNQLIDDAKPDETGQFDYVEFVKMMLSK
jgi:Ca2+-binding EF-hand superfamily protein